MFNKFYFDDSEVIEFFEEKNNIILKLKNVTDRNLMLFNGTVTFKDVKSVTIGKGLIDSKPPKSIEMVYKDGYIIHFEQETEDKLYMIIEWCDPITCEETWITYQIISHNVQWEHEETGLHVSSL